ncbi:hemagglutinin repeat-containing protein [Thauera linaloolentis]|uniref:hemagglutinin repeat-containing protein n=1 Tax=Thauera linaloolentis TaxID=76112 RepID=UPI003312FD27
MWRCSAGRGAVVSADRVAANIGGNLVIESLQDIHTFESEQKSAGFGGIAGDTAVRTGNAPDSGAQVRDARQWHARPGCRTGRTAARLGAFPMPVARLAHSRRIFAHAYARHRSHH